jgi:hypothetical protein
VFAASLPHRLVGFKHALDCSAGTCSTAKRAGSGKPPAETDHSYTRNACHGESVLAASNLRLWTPITARYRRFRYKLTRGRTLLVKHTPAPHAGTEAARAPRSRRAEQGHAPCASDRRGDGRPPVLGARFGPPRTCIAVISACSQCSNQAGVAPVPAFSLSHGIRRPRFPDSCIRQAAAACPGSGVGAGRPRMHVSRREASAPLPCCWISRSC